MFDYCIKDSCSALVFLNSTCKSNFKSNWIIIILLATHRLDGFWFHLQFYQRRLVFSLPNHLSLSKGITLPERLSECILRAILWNKRLDTCNEKWNSRDLERACHFFAGIIKFSVQENCNSLGRSVNFFTAMLLIISHLNLVSETLVFEWVFIAVNRV